MYIYQLGDLMKRHQELEELVFNYASELKKIMSPCIYLLGGVKVYE
jgi:hypothetical protein